MNDEAKQSSGVRKRLRTLSTRLGWASRAPYLKSLPEWEMFPDEQSRNAAIKEIERQMMPRSISGVFMFLLAVIIFFSLPMMLAMGITGWILPWIGVHLGLWQDRLMWALAIIGYTIVVYIAIRRDMPKALRYQLLKRGVPVCMTCGYDLRGLPADRSNCPECGKILSDEIRSML